MTGGHLSHPSQCPYAGESIGENKEKGINNGAAKVSRRRKKEVVLGRKPHARRWWKKKVGRSHRSQKEEWEGTKEGSTRGDPWGAHTVPALR